MKRVSKLVPLKWRELLKSSASLFQKVVQNLLQTDLSFLWCQIYCRVVKLLQSGAILQQNGADFTKLHGIKNEVFH